MAVGINPGATIPLQEAFQPVSAADATQQGITMAGQQVDLAEGKLKLDEDQDAKRDKDTVQAYLRSGGDLFSQAGIDKAVGDLKGKVSPKTYMGFAQHSQDFQKSQALVADQLAKTDDDKLTAYGNKLDTVARTLAPVYETYQQDIAQRLKAKGLDQKTAPQNELTQAQQDALPAYQAAMQARLQQLGQANLPGMDPKALQTFAQMGPDDLRGTLQYTKFYQDLIKTDQERRLKESQVAKNNALSKIAGTGKPLADLNAVNEALKDPDLSADERTSLEALRKKLTTPSGSGAKMTAEDFSKLSPTEQKSIDAAAWDRILTGKEPPARGGLYAQVMGYIEDIATENNMSVQDLLNASSDIKTRLQAKRTFEQRVLNINRAEGVMNNEIPVMEQNMKAIDLSKYPDISHIDLVYLRHKGDPNVIKLDQSAEPVMNEFQAIVTGNIGGALNVTDVQKAAEDYKKIQTPQGMQAWIDNARQMIERAKSANEGTRKDWMKGISDAVGGKSPLTRLQGGTQAPAAPAETITAGGKPIPANEIPAAKAVLDAKGPMTIDGETGKPVTPTAATTPAQANKPPPNVRTTINGRPVEWVGKSPDYPNGYRYKDAKPKAQVQSQNDDPLGLFQKEMT